MAEGPKTKVVCNGTEDIISNLSGNLIDRILTHMPIRDAARTSILSTEWRYTWTRHPRIILDKKFFNEAIKKPSIQIQYAFTSIISKILLLHSGPILKFHLYIPNLPFDWKADIDQWMIFLWRNEIKELILVNSKRQYPYKLPSCIYSCSHLMHLKLTSCILRPPPSFTGFQNLTTLLLRRIAFAADVFGTLVPSTPLLLCLSFAICTGLEHFFIDAPKLQLLSIYDCNEVQLNLFKMTSVLGILRIAHCWPLGYLELWEPISLANLFCHLPRIARLSLDHLFLKLLAAGSVPKRLPTTAVQLKQIRFSKLKFNDLEQISCALCLLSSSPNLQDLEIRVWDHDELNDTEPVINFLEAPDCMDQMLHKLQLVKIKRIRGLRAELLLIKLLLAQSPSLERMFVELSGTVVATERLRISTELMRFPRVSPKAQLIYSLNGSRL